MVIKLLCTNFRLKSHLFTKTHILQDNKGISIMKKQSGTTLKLKVASGPAKDSDTTMNIKPKFEVLPSPTKSFSDKKDYKVIRLENGLTACLISDMAKPVNVAALLSKESDESDSDKESEEERAGSDVSEDGDQKFRNKKKHTDEVKMAAAALCVDVGSFSDPKEVPGLAHFLEHMVFMGSSRYPKENDFDAFIKKHGGSDNAATDYETTTFYFECFEKHLYQALDKFANFFISPLMKKESMTRERQAVESEFQLAAPSDDYRKEQLFISLAKEGSPVKSFSWGNLVTLRDNISADDLYEKLHQFRTRHYSAHRMTVAVQARLPMNMLEAYVVNCFSAVPNNELPPDNFKPHMEGVLDTPEFKRLYFVKPVKDICQVDLTWALPPLQHLYKSKPQVYISWLLGHEGLGSLLSYLKQKVWALSLYAGNGETGVEFNSIYASFTVNIVLTREGFIHLKDVVGAVFSYLQMLKQLGPNERVFKEIQRIEEISFRFEEDEDASDKVEELVENMQYYPPQDYLTGPNLIFDYNPEAIVMLLNQLVPEKMNMMIMTTELPDQIEYKKIEPWFKTQYTDTHIPSDWMKSWLVATPLKGLALPDPNPFITEDFSILSIEENIPLYPVKILETPMIELWYRKDQKFQLPMAYYYYYLITPLSMESVRSACMMQMFVVFLNMNLAEEAYAAQLAELSYSIQSCEKGICVKITGYNQKLPVLISMIAKYLATVSSKLTSEVFEAVKEKQTKSFYNAFLKPSKLCKDLRLSMLEKQYFSLIEKHAAISGITFQMMKTFSKSILENLYIQGLVQGNVTSNIALQTTKIFLIELKCKPLKPSDYPKIEVKEIPKGEHCCRVMSFNKDNANSIITNYYQIGPMSIKKNVTLELIVLLLEEPLFDILRTKEQLGYNVYCTIRDTYDVLGFSITVNTQANKHTVEHVDSRIEAFLNHIQQLLKKLKDKKFSQAKKDLLQMKQFVDVDLEDEVARNWEEIVNLKYMFDRLNHEIKAIEKLKISEVRKWWEDHITNKKSDQFRKLSVQVVGHVIQKPNEEDRLLLKFNKTSVNSDSSMVAENIKNFGSKPSGSNDKKKEAASKDANEVEPLPSSSGVEPHASKYRNKESKDKNRQKAEDEAALQTGFHFNLQFIEDKEEAQKKNQKNFVTDFDTFKKQLRTISKFSSKTEKQAN